MKALFYAALITSCIASNHPSYGVYLEYEDSESKRAIRVDFRDLDDVYSKDREVRKEGSRRISKMLAKEALSFTDKMTVKTSQRGMFTYTSREKDFFTSPGAPTFIEWIERCAELGKLEFLGADEETQVESVKQSFLRIIDHQKSTLEEDFVLLEPKELLPEDIEASELDRMGTSVSLKTDFLPKFRHVLIRCTGVHAEAVKREIRKICSSQAPLFANFKVEK